jgi:hypothetical protein
MAKLTLDPANIERILRSGGWPCDRIAPDTWRSHIRTRRASFPFFVKLDPAGYVCLAIVPFLRSPEEQPKCDKLYRKLLDLNQSLLMAKFSIDDDLDIVLSVEYPTASIDESEVADALDTRSYYADRHYDELRALLAATAEPANPP